MSEALTGAIPKIGEKIPDFEAVTTQGSIKSSDFEGKWTVFFSHPADFTPVCTTELVAFARKQPEFEALGVQLVGLSIDSVHSHLAWIRNMEENLGVKITYPLIADLDMKVAQKFGMIHAGASATATVRAVFIIDPHGVVRTLVYYPMNVGRFIDEIYRVVQALQTADKNGVSCPADWRPGEKVIVPPPKTVTEMDQRDQMQGVERVDFYLVKRDL
jgi:peroxiredoxin 2/4